MPWYKLQTGAGQWCCGGIVQLFAPKNPTRWGVAAVDNAKNCTKDEPAPMVFGSWQQFCIVKKHWETRATAVKLPSETVRLKAFVIYVCSHIFREGSIHTIYIDLICNLTFVSHYQPGWRNTSQANRINRTHPEVSVLHCLSVTLNISFFNAWDVGLFASTSRLLRANIAMGFARSRSRIMICQPVRPFVLSDWVWTWFVSFCLMAQS